MQQEFIAGQQRIEAGRAGKWPQHHPARGRHVTSRSNRHPPRRINPSTALRPPRQLPRVRRRLSIRGGPRFAARAHHWSARHQGG